MSFFTSFLFDSYPREMGKPYRVTISREKELIQFAKENSGLNDVFITIYKLDLEVDKLFFDFDEPFAFEFASKFAKYLYKTNRTYASLITPSKGYHVYVLVKPTYLKGNELEQKKTLANAQLYLIEQSGCFFPVEYRIYELTDSIKPYYKHNKQVSYFHYYLFTKDPIAEAKYKNNKIHAYTRINASEFDPKKHFYVPACDMKVIGDLRRFGRLPNTKKKMDGVYNYCTYIPHDFFNMKEEKVLMLKKSPHAPYTLVGNIPSISEYLKPVNTNFNTAIVNSIDLEDHLPEYIPDNPFLQLIQRIINPGVFRANLSPEPTQEARFQFVCELKELGWNINRVMDACRSIRWGDYKEKKCMYQVKQIFHKNYKKMGKKSLLALGLATNEDFETMKKRAVWNLK